MCRSLDAGGRRCPCAEPTHRNAQRRARYAADRASVLERPVGVRPPDEEASPSAEVDVEMLDHQAATALADLRAGVGDASAAEAAVTALGRRLLADIEAELPPSPLERVAERVAVLKADRTSIEESWRVVRRRMADAPEERDTLRPQASALSALYEDLGAELRSLLLGVDADTIDFGEKLRTAVARRVAERRPLGGSLITSEESTRVALDALRKVAGFFPSAWIEASNSCPHPLRVRTSMRQMPDDGNGSIFGTKPRRRRAHYVHVTVAENHPDAATCDSLLALPPSSEASPQRMRAVAAHEFVHRYEAVEPALPLLEAAFVARRCVGADGEMLPAVPAVEGASKPEMVRPDHFVDAYIGRDYGDARHFEVLSTGLEAIFGAFGHLLGTGVLNDQPDRDHLAFVLGCLAAV